MEDFSINIISKYQTKHYSNELILNQRFILIIDAIYNIKIIDLFRLQSSNFL